MNRRNMLFAALTTLIVAGCASGPKYSEMRASMPTLKAGEGRIFVYRDSFFGAAVQPTIYLNMQPIGSSQANSFVYADRPAGEYKISASTEVERSVTFKLAPGEIKYVQSSISFGLLVGRINFDLVNAAAGEAAIRDLSHSR